MALQNIAGEGAGAAEVCDATMSKLITNAG